MTTATVAQSIRTTTAQPRPSLEELVDRVIAALFKEETEPQAPATTVTQSVARSVHDAQPRPSLEELVDRVIAALFKKETEPQAPTTTATQSVARTVHDARRIRKAGDLDRALEIFAGVDTAKAETKEARWAFTEWTQLVKRRFGDRKVVVYSQGTGRAAALVPTGDGALEVAAVLGMSWRPGKVVSRRSLRGLKPLAKGRA